MFTVESCLDGWMWTRRSWAGEPNAQERLWRHGAERRLNLRAWNGIQTVEPSLRQSWLVLIHRNTRQRWSTSMVPLENYLVSSLTAKHHGRPEPDSPTPESHDMQMIELFTSRYSGHFVELFGVWVKQWLFFSWASRGQFSAGSRFGLDLVQNYYAPWRTSSRYRGPWQEVVPPQVAQPQTVVPSGYPDLCSALVRVLAVPEWSGSGPQEHPVGLLHGWQEQEDPAALGESNRTAPRWVQICSYFYNLLVL